MRWSEVSLSEHRTGDVNVEEGVIRGVRICGRESANGREYTDQALRDAARLYEGVRVNYDHPAGRDPTAERDFGDFAGQLHGCTFDPARGGTYGELHVALEGRHAKLVLESAARFPKSFGLSHVASADASKVKRERGLQVIQGIDSVESVDLVTRPATAEGLFESLDHTSPERKTMKIREILSSAPAKTKFRKVLVEMIDAGELAPEMEIEAAPEESPEDQLRKGLIAMIVAKLDAATPEEMQSVLDVFGIEDSLTAGNGAGEAEEAAAESVKTTKLEKRLAMMEATNLLLSADVEATPERVAAIAAVDTVQRQPLVESWPKRHPAPERRSFRPRPLTSPPAEKATSVSEAVEKSWDARVAAARAKVR